MDIVWLVTTTWDGRLPWNRGIGQCRRRPCRCTRSAGVAIIATTDS